MDFLKVNLIVEQWVLLLRNKGYIGAFYYGDAPLDAISMTSYPLKGVNWGLFMILYGKLY